MNFDSATAIFDALIEKYKVKPAQLVLPEWEPPPENELKTLGDGKTLDLGEDWEAIEQLLNRYELFQHQGKLGAVYIHTRAESNMPRWHATMCGKLRQYQREGRLDKYGAHFESNDFLFHHPNYLNYEFKGRPEVCALCLGELSRLKHRWRQQGKYQYTDYVAEFADFIDGTKIPETPATLIPKNQFKRFSDTKANTYNPDFGRLSLEMRKQQPFCTDCQIHYPLQYLQVHHKNELRYDDAPSNLTVLCLICHSIVHARGNHQLAYASAGKFPEMLQIAPQANTYLQKLLSALPNLKNQLTFER